MLRNVLKTDTLDLRGYKQPRRLREKMSNAETFYDLVEKAPDYADRVAKLADWSQNYDSRTGTPSGVFLDLIGYSEDNFGENLVKNPQKVLGFLEMDYLADALRQYADRPADVSEFVYKLVTAEQ